MCVANMFSTAGSICLRLGRDNMLDSGQSSESFNIMRDALVNMALDSWRFARVFKRAVSKLDAGERNRYAGQLLWFTKKIEESLAQVELEIVDIEGSSFDPGIAATPLNIGDFEISDSLVVDSMLEPIIMGKDGLVKPGTVILRKDER